MVDTALITMYEGERPGLEIPDFALDMHTSKGRRMDRGVNHFFDEGAKCANEVFFASKGSRGFDPYVKRAHEARRLGKHGHADQMEFEK
jgi:hypothetical protein